MDDCVACRRNTDGASPALDAPGGVESARRSSPAATAPFSLPGDADDSETPSPYSNDRPLVLDLARDLDAAFPRLVEHMSPRLYWGLRRMTGDGHQAEDLSQEALIRAYRALSGYPPERIRELRLEPWVWTIAINTGRNHLRDRARRPTLVAEATEPGGYDLEPPDTAAWQRRLNTLNRIQRQAVVLRHVVGFGIPEIADITGRPEGTCKADIHRGLKKLREIMENEDEH